MKKFALSGICLLGCLVARLPASQWNYTGVDNGLWNTPANWTLNGGGTHLVPANGDDAVLGLSTSVSNVTFNGNYTGAGLNSLTLDSPLHAQIALNQTGASAMIATTEYIGTTVSQNFYNQSAGTNTTSTLYLGFSTGGFGTYNLSNVGTLTAGTEFIGYAGTGGGIFTQSGGTNNVTNALVIGQTGTNLSNAYNLSGGTINFGVNASLYVGNAARGTFTQSAGSVNFSGASSALTIGTAAASTGNLYTLSGTGVITGVGRISIGLSGSGTMTQTGGSITLGAGGTFAVGDSSGSTGFYNLSATTGTGSLAADSFIVANAGNGTFSQSGGTVTTNGVNVGLFSGGIGAINQTAGTLNVNGSGLISFGTNVGASGTYTIDASAGASALNATALRIGDGGTGTFTENGGTVTISSVGTIGRLAGSNGTYNLNSGILNAGVNPTPVNFFVGGSGTGTMNQAGGTFTLAGGSQASLSLGSTGGTGTYNLSGGSITTQFLQPGNGGTGNFIQTGGTVNATQLNISTTPASNGSYALSGGAAVTLGVSNFEAIGVSASGLFTQNGGTHTLGGDLQLGQNASGTGIYNLTGGAFNIAGNIGIGQSGAGFFNQSGGTLTVNNGVYIGSGFGSSGSYTLNSGSASISTIFVGNSGPGGINQTGGSLNVASLFIGSQFNTPAATGAYSQSGGTLNVSSAAYLGIGGATSAYTLSGNGVLNAPNSPNTFNDFFIGGTGTFTQSGGTVNGYVFNSGQFVFHGGTFNGTLENGANGTASFDSFVYFGAGLKNHGILDIAGGQVGTAAGQTFLNDGTITLSASGQIYSNGPVINNGLITGTGSIGGSSTFVNNLSIVQGNGPLTFSYAAAINDGTISLASGRALNLFGGLTNSGDLEINGASILQNGTLTNAANGTVGGPGSILVSFANSGVVTPEAGTLNIANAWTNAGVVQLSGITSNLTGGVITNTGTIQGVGNLGAAVTNSTGIIEAIGGSLVVGGNLTNSAGGTLAAGVGDKLIVSGGLVTNSGLISLTGGTFDNNNHALTNTGEISGFGTLRTGGTGLTNAGSITFTGGNTTVNGNVTNNVGQTIRISYDPAIFTGNVVNNGTFKTTSTTVSFAGTFTNNGIFTSDPATQNFVNLTISSSGALQGGTGDVFNVTGDLRNHSNQAALFDLRLAQISVFNPGPHDLEWSGADLGNTWGGYANNFALGTLRLGAGGVFNLLDGNSTPGGAFYVLHLQLDGGLAEIANIHGNGMNIYYDPLNAGNAYLNGGTYALVGGGFIEPVPEPGTWALLVMGGFALAAVARLRTRARQNFIAQKIPLSSSGT